MCRKLQQLFWIVWCLHVRKSIRNCYWICFWFQSNCPQPLCARTTYPTTRFACFKNRLAWFFSGENLVVFRHFLGIRHNCFLAIIFIINFHFQRTFFIQEVAEDLYACWKEVLYMCCIAFGRNMCICEFLCSTKLTRIILLFLSIFHHNTGVIQVLGRCNRVGSFGWCNFSKFHCNGRIMVIFKFINFFRFHPFNWNCVKKNYLEF